MYMRLCFYVGQSYGLHIFDGDMLHVLSVLTNITVLSGTGSISTFSILACGTTSSITSVLISISLWR